MRLAGLLEGVDAVRIAGDPQVEVSGICHDSRSLNPGDLFVAWRGQRYDAHAFVPAALAAGAAAVMVEQADALPGVLAPGHAAVLVRDTRAAVGPVSAALYGYPTAHLRLVGITGTNGKTTTAFLTRAVLQELGPVGLVGTVVSVVGAESRRARLTTPEAPDLQRLFQDMVGSGDLACVMEVSSQSLARHRVDGSAFDVGVFTNLTPDHLGPGEHPSFHHYRESKARLFSLLGQTPRGAARKDVPRGAALNWDDPNAARMAEAVPRGVPVLRFGLGADADVVATDVELDPTGARFAIRHPGGVTRCQLALSGRFNVYNALGAFSVGMLYGVEAERAAEALGRVRGVPGRLEQVPGPQPFTVLIDYAHTPDGLENVLQAAREFTRGRVVAVFGCGGDRDRTKRPLMGEIGVRLADLVWLTSDNPRTEPPQAILAEVEAGAARVSGGHYHVCVDRRQAIGEALAEARPGDVVVIAGKGHEDYQIFADRTIHFDDREEAAMALARLGYR